MNRSLLFMVIILNTSFIVSAQADHPDTIILNKQIHIDKGEHYQNMTSRIEEINRMDKSQLSNIELNKLSIEMANLKKQIAMRVDTIDKSSWIVIGSCLLFILIL